MNKIVKVCDRCGKEAVVRSASVNPNSWNVSVIYTDRNSPAQRYLDFCSDCIVSFNRWLNSCPKN